MRCSNSEHRNPEIHASFNIQPAGCDLDPSTLWERGHGRRALCRKRCVRNCGRRRGATKTDSEVYYLQAPPPQLSDGFHEKLAVLGSGHSRPLASCRTRSMLSHTIAAKPTVNNQSTFAVQNQGNSSRRAVDLQPRPRRVLDEVHFRNYALKRSRG